jgi:hypothetical protein
VTGLKILKLIYNDENIYIHRISKDAAYLQKLQNIENDTGRPISSKNTDFEALETKWIFAPGLHLGIDQHNHSIVLAARITYVHTFLHILRLICTRPWDGMSDASEADIKECLQILMDWAGVVNAIKINGVCASYPFMSIMF